VGSVFVPGETRCDGRGAPRGGDGIKGENDDDAEEHVGDGNFEYRVRTVHSLERLLHRAAYATSGSVYVARGSWAVESPPKNQECIFHSCVPAISPARVFGYHVPFERRLPASPERVHQVPPHRVRHDSGPRVSRVVACVVVGVSFPSW